MSLPESASGARSPMPEPLPRRLAGGRLDALDRMSWAIAVDIHATAEDLAASGWSGEALADALAGCRQWWHDLVDAAADVAEVFRRAAA